MNTSVLQAKLMAPAIVLSSLFYSDPVRPDQCFTPSFASAVTFDAGTNPLSIAVADFDGDTKLDLAVANADSVSVLLGNGDGTFQTAVNYDAGSYPSSVVTGDLNGDKQPDLVVDITGTMDVKLKAITCHASQVGDFSVVEARMRARAAVLGKAKGYPYAEGFDHVVVPG